MNTDRFKFRVWWKSPYTNVSSKYLYYDPQENNYRTDIIRNADCDFAEDIIYYDLRDIILGNIDEYERPGTFTVEQCTGLKDKNGNLIYEGDILLLRNNNFEVGHNGITVFFKCLTDEYIHIDPLDFDYNHSEIIGNVHEQKENK